jgi:hypothetical protein
MNKNWRKKLVEKIIIYLTKKLVNYKTKVSNGGIQSYRRRLQPCEENMNESSFLFSFLAGHFFLWIHDFRDSLEFGSNPDRIRIRNTDSIDQWSFL